jgi:hypothetical protein
LGGVEPLGPGDKQDVDEVPLPLRSPGRRHRGMVDTDSLTVAFVRRIDSADSGPGALLPSLLGTRTV